MWNENSLHTVEVSTVRADENENNEESSDNSSLGEEEEVEEPAQLLIIIKTADGEKLNRLLSKQP
jgi:hypothetical protein